MASWFGHGSVAASSVLVGKVCRGRSADVITLLRRDLSSAAALTGPLLPRSVGHLADWEVERRRSERALDSRETICKAMEDSSYGCASAPEARG